MRSVTRRNRAHRLTNQSACTNDDSNSSDDQNSSRRSSFSGGNSLRSSRRNTINSNASDNDFQLEVLALASAAKAETVAAILSAEAIYDNNRDNEEQNETES